MVYIALGPVDEHGKVTAMLINENAGSRSVRKIQYEDELKELKREWGVDEVRGEGLLQLKKRP
jgi:hypothetical protein